jgi:hypothetical protein
MQQEFSRTYEFRISQDTVRRRLTEADLHPYTPAKGPLLTSDHRRQRLLFANEHLNWNYNDWANVKSVSILNFHQHCILRWKYNRQHCLVKNASDCIC